MSIIDRRGARSLRRGIRCAEPEKTRLRAAARNAQRSPQQPGRSVRRRAAHESTIDGARAL